MKTKSTKKKIILSLAVLVGAAGIATSASALVLTGNGTRFEYGPQWIPFYIRQNSNYRHNTRSHRTTSMVNKHYTYSLWVNPKVTAYASTPWFRNNNIKSYNSYYDYR